MSGNEGEYLNDWYGASFGGYADGRAESDPIGPSSGTFRAVRAGQWNYPSSWSTVCYRSWGYMSYPDNAVGFRLARTIP